MSEITITFEEYKYLRKIKDKSIPTHSKYLKNPFSDLLMKNYIECHNSKIFISPTGKVALENYSFAYRKKIKENITLIISILALIISFISILIA